MAAGTLARSLAGAVVTGPSFAMGALSPGFLAQVGRALVERGECLYVIGVSPEGELRLFPSSGWSIDGDFDQASWTVDADLPGPSVHSMRRVRYDGVLHFVWGTSTRSPHVGRGPFDGSGLTARLGVESERGLGDEASGPVAPDNRDTPGSGWG